MVSASQEGGLCHVGAKSSEFSFYCVLLFAKHESSVFLHLLPITQSSLFVDYEFFNTNHFQKIR